jgi:hypothetical protein
MVALSLTVGMYAAACAADAGDPLKVFTQSTTAPDGSIIGEDASDTSDATTPPDDATTAGNDAPGTVIPPDDGGPPTETGTTPVEDTGAPPVDAGPPPDVGVGAGCAAGATVIVLMPGASHTANTNNFGTVAAVCVELMGNVNQGWGLSNGQGRMLTMTSAAGTSATIDAGGSIASLPQAPQAGPDGFVYWNFTADTQSVNYTSVYIF